MTKLEQIEKSILELSDDELKAFAEWFDAMQERNFDSALERDVRDGKLKGFAEKALADLDAGRTRPL